MIPVRRLNHAVLYVRDADRAAAFYQEAFGFEVVQHIPGVAAFLKAAGTTNHHDLGLFSIGANAPGPERGRVGLYHLAWEVPSIHDLAAGRETLARLVDVVELPAGTVELDGRELVVTLDPVRALVVGRRAVPALLELAPDLVTEPREEVTWRAGSPGPALRLHPA